MKENLICLPKGIEAQDGDDFTGKVAGKVVDHEGKLYLEAVTLNGKPVQMGEDEYQDSDEEEPKDEMDMRADEAFDSYMKNKEGQTQ